MNGAIHAVGGKLLECGPQEGGKLRLAHLPGRHRELAVPDTAEPADVAVDPHIVGRVGEHHFGALAGHERLIDGAIECIAAQQAVCPKDPQVTSSRYRGTRDRRIRDLVFRTRRLALRLGSVVQHDVDVGGGKTCELDLKAKIDEGLKLDGEDLAIPSGLLGMPVVRQNVSSFLCL